MKKILNKSIKKVAYKRGDKIKIINPEFFIRCGYLWNIQYVIDNIITKEQKDSIIELIKKFEIKCYYTKDDLFKGNIEDDSIYNKILNELSYRILRRNGFGGKERKIFTEKKEEYLNCRAVVRGKKVVNTGTYNYGYISYEGEYGPPYLSNKKSHIILDVEVFDENKKPEGMFNLTFGDELRIEEKNVEKVVYEEF